MKTVFLFLMVILTFTTYSQVNIAPSYKVPSSRFAKLQTCPPTCGAEGQFLKSNGKYMGWVNNIEDTIPSYSDYEIQSMTTITPGIYLLDLNSLLHERYISDGGVRLWSESNQTLTGWVVYLTSRGSVKVAKNATCTTVSITRAEFETETVKYYAFKNGKAIDSKSVIFFRANQVQTPDSIENYLKFQ